MKKRKQTSISKEEIKNEKKKTKKYKQILGRRRMKRDKDFKKRKKS